MLENMASVELRQKELAKKVAQQIQVKQMQAKIK